MFENMGFLNEFRAPTMVDFKQGRPKMADAVNMKLYESFLNQRANGVFEWTAAQRRDGRRAGCGGLQARVAAAH